MTILEILAKVAKGETLTEEERKAAGEFNPNAIAAAARKSAEEKLAETLARQAEVDKELKALQAKVKEAEMAGKTDLEKAQARIKELQTEHATATKALADSQAALKAHVRGSKVQRLFGSLRFIEGIDVEMVKAGFAGRLAGIDDDKLDDDSVTKPIVDAFMEANKGILADTSGHGSGQGPKAGTQGGKGNEGSPTDPSKQTPEQREADLKKKGIL